MSSHRQEADAMEASKRKREETTTADDASPNSELSRLLMELADYEKTAHGEQWKYLTFRKAAQTLSEHPTQIKSGKEAQELPGIGEGIGAKIDEFLKTGGMKKVKEARHDNSAKDLADLERIPGIGHAKAQSLVDKGINSIEELRKNPVDLTDAQRVALKYLEDIETPIPRPKAKKIEVFLEHQLKELHNDLDVTLCGAYRRHEKTVLELVAVITHKSTKQSPKELTHEILIQLKKSGFIVDTLHESNHRFKGVCHLPLSSKNGSKNGDEKQDSGSASDDEGEGGSNAKKPGAHHLIELCIFPEDQYYSAILHCTGSDVFAQELSSKAKEKGYLLNEFGLHQHREGSSGDRGDAVKVDSEEEIFRLLDMDYVTPENRNA